MIRENIQRIRDSIENIKIKNGIRREIQLMAVSKTYPAQAVIEAIEAGQCLFGENRVQEASAKFSDEQLKKGEFQLHIIGHLQRNKTKEAIKIASMIESIDKLETLLELEKQCAKMEKRIDYLIEINSSGEVQKSGVYPEEMDPFMEKILSHPFHYCNLRGVMTVGPLTEEEKQIRKAFQTVYTLYENWKSHLKKEDFDIVSMGMSSDYPIAIEEGSNLIRVGTAIFGRRE